MMLDPVGKQCRHLQVWSGTLPAPMSWRCRPVVASTSARRLGGQQVLICTNSMGAAEVRFRLGCYPILAQIKVAWRDLDRCAQTLDLLLFSAPRAPGIRHEIRVI
jgi:hypothetical protein